MENTSHPQPKETFWRKKPGVQYSSKYVAGFWTRTSTSGTVMGSPVQQTVLPVTYGWLRQAQ